MTSKMQLSVFEAFMLSKMTPTMLAITQKGHEESPVQPSSEKTEATTT
jgi:hypothetical protein